MATRRRKTSLNIVLVLAVLVAGVCVPAASAQELGGAGTVQGTVKGPTGDVMPSVDVKITNPVSGFRRTTIDRRGGEVRLSQRAAESLPLTVSAQGFQTLQRDVTVGPPCRST